MTPPVPSSGNSGDLGDSGDGAAFLLTDGEPERPRRRPRRGRKRLILAGCAAACTLAAVLGVRSVLLPLIRPDDFEGAGTGAVTVEIKPGQSAGQIADTLAEAGVVATSRSFVKAVRERAKENSLRPGRYRLARGMAAGAALDRLLDESSRVVRRVAVPEGLWAGEALSRLAKGSGIPLAQLQQVVAAPHGLGLPAYAGGVEGYLFPATYEVEPNTTAKDLVRAMVTRFRRTAEELRLDQAATGVKLTPREVVVVASIIQAEGGRDEDYPKIARVIYNRLAKGRKLEMDSTVNYVQGRRTLRVSEKDIKVASPYNTYRYAGLPPGPIGSPGEKALKAALHPAEGDWYWFVTTDPGRRITKFTDSEGEFVKYREELNRYLGAD
ncbi:endolytic transglycosylase MltG [Acrocarpospora catenulata]|uniref:endolytic transglycosylase MltG n=1 Tax=Acrocarpospora catenulata TaxID=2836182 RepID=UPI0027E08907|nr:endolytic transglycosylase MltG [Acrocarpospora catenulata]